MITKPFIKYPGGKTNELPLINQYKPKNIERYFEPFVGGGSVFFDLSITKSFINDKSKDLYLLYLLAQKQDKDLKQFLTTLAENWVKLNVSDKLEFNNLNFSKELFQKFYLQSVKRKESLINKMILNGNTISEENKKELYLTARKTAYYMCVRHLYNNNPSENFIRVGAFVFLREFCYSSMFRFNGKGQFNVPYGGMSYNDKNLNTKIDAIFNPEVKKILSTTEIFNDDFENFFKHFQFTQNDFIFLDPPYDTEFSTYDQNSFTKDDQIRLRNVLSNVKANFMLVIKRTDFIADLYKDFYLIEYDKKYMVSFKNRNSKEATHLLITNYYKEV